MSADIFSKFKKSMEVKFTQEYGSNQQSTTDITGKTEKFLRLGPAQDARKAEMIKAGKEIAEKRGLVGYNPMMHTGAPLGQRAITPYTISGTDIVCEPDDLHYVNNAAMQQMWDDIRRTCIVGLDMAHETLEKRLGKEVTPETINHYLETLNHAMPGAAVVQEMMIETHPALVDDCYVKVFTGDDELADEIDKQYVININKMFNEEQAAQIKASIGKTTWQAIHIPTIVSRTTDGAQTSRWAAMQIGMSFISAYNMCAGEAAVADLSFAAKHASLVSMGEMLPARRARGPNEPGGLSFGHMADIIQTSRVKAEDPAKVSLEVVGAGCMLYDQIWLGSYMSGGVGFTQYATAAYTDDILDNNTYYDVDYINDKYNGAANVGQPTVKASLEVIKDIATESTIYGIETYEKFPTALEDHFGGSQRATVLAAASGVACALATGNGNAGLSGWYLSMYVHKEAWGRLGFFGFDLQDQCGATNICTYQGDEGLAGELRGPNYPNYAMNVGHQGGYGGIASAAHSTRGDAFAVNPLIKVCFADDLMPFDFTAPRREFGRGAIREFVPAGERSLIIPAK
ncbi:MAG: coenzyme-B sulfoethylthiotransferase subunit alpha [Methanosarcina sp.]|jgi:methyl-coenzyme M reductase alpha subunit|uniref:coenzyme-B sulfoethylthiotransferase subunit alpha n=1 Tax=Methanosarcina sp. TaxID=2213 RepID=UPI002610D408|nr:coenzyme-B sulfoethylthiotransferase subunit alpha [Methanosarcina sp.]MDD3245823.1 coenzyme-B sulfoethylthiotransferase subunit alpha [Methanosarcina sp.]MDD4249997.1 coenzyme-B sulfoethylthiotransferase subunit alpha [Methanosarcina sp.]